MGTFISHGKSLNFPWEKKNFLSSHGKYFFPWELCFFPWEIHFSHGKSLFFPWELWFFPWEMLFFPWELQIQSSVSFFMLLCKGSNQTFCHLCLVGFLYAKNQQYSTNIKACQICRIRNGKFRPEGVIFSVFIW